MRCYPLRLAATGFYCVVVVGIVVLALSWRQYYITTCIWLVRAQTSFSLSGGGGNCIKDTPTFTQLPNVSESECRAELSWAKTREKEAETNSVLLRGCLRRICPPTRSRLYLLYVPFGGTQYDSRRPLIRLACSFGDMKNSLSDSLSRSNFAAASNRRTSPTLRLLNTTMLSDRPRELRSYPIASSLSDAIGKSSTRMSPEVSLVPGHAHSLVSGLFRRMPLAATSRLARSRDKFFYRRQTPRSCRRRRRFRRCN